MEYPLISEYREAILSAEDNFNELSFLRPVLDDCGNPVMSSGNFAVVFKMRDENDGKLYAVKCFIKDQEGRDESYRKIADELEMVSSSYVLPLRYLENELFVDNDHCSEEEFPVVVMEWVEGETLDAYLNRNLHDTYELEMLSYRFNRMAAWLLAQPFAHSDLKPDNILVRKDGSLVLVDYDGMFVPAMKGEKAREIGSPDYRHPSRTDTDFDEHIDDFSIAVIALSFKAIALNPSLKSSTTSSDGLLLESSDFQDSANSAMLKRIISSSSDSDLSLLLSAFFMALAKNSLDMLSLRFFMTEKPKRMKNGESIIEDFDTSVTDKDIEEGIMDEYGVIYSKDGKRLLCYNDEFNYNQEFYRVKDGTEIICDSAFSINEISKITLPNSVIAIGDKAFNESDLLEEINIPDSVISIGSHAFAHCYSLHRICIPSSVRYIKDNPFLGNVAMGMQVEISVPSNPKFHMIDDMLIDSNGVLVSCVTESEHISIPNGVSMIGNNAFQGCGSIKSIDIPSTVTIIGKEAFSDCCFLECINIPPSVTYIGDEAFFQCGDLKRVTMPDTLQSIGNNAFRWCYALQHINIPKSVYFIGTNPFIGCVSLTSSADDNNNFQLIDKMLIDSKGVLISCLNQSEEVSIPACVSIIGESAFRECRALRKINIPNSVTHIENFAFIDCDSLKDITIPAGVLEIKEYAFSLPNEFDSILIINLSHHTKYSPAISRSLFFGEIKLIRY